MDYTPLQHLIAVLDKVELTDMTVKYLRKNEELKDVAVWNGVQDNLREIIPTFEFVKDWKNICIQRTKKVGQKAFALQEAVAMRLLRGCYEAAMRLL